MCGIAGIFNPPADALQHLKLMLGAIAKRGPDGGGWAAFGSDVIVDRALDGVPPPRPLPYEPWAVLGHQRLAILDVSSAGLQPMKSPSSRWWTVLNGEIYNFVELRDELKSLGHQFRTGTDTEVLLAALEEWDEECLHRFDGMFAFAAIEAKTRRLLLVRDRFGEKPLYYRVTGDTLAFASELPSLLRSGDRSDTGVVADFLVHANASPADGKTFVHGIHQVPAAHLLRLSGSRGVQLDRWYSLAPATPAPKSDQEVVVRTQELLTRSVRRRLRSDVPVGTCLSGGLDSSTIAAIAAEQLGAVRLHAFTAVPDDERDSELDWATRVAKHRDLELHVVRVDAAELVRDFTQLVRAQGEPFTTLSMYNQYKVMEAARKAGVVVMLDGQGGDEAFLGYPRFFGAAALELSRRHPIRAFQLLRRFGRNGALKRGDLVRILAMASSTASGYKRIRRVRSVLRSDVIAKAVRAPGLGSDVRALQLREILCDTLPPLLRFEDRNAMRWAVESRLPYLDHELIEFTLSLPTELKLKHGWSKWPLRMVADSLLTKDVAWRKDKMGFQAPTGRWLREIFKSLDIDKDARSAHLYDQAPWTLIRSGAIDELLAFRIVSLECWMRALRIS